MKYFAAIFLALSLSGCATFWCPAPKTVVQEEYIVKIPPAETMTLPAKVPNIDVDKASQGDVSKWLVQKEDYTKQLEDKLHEIAKFFNDEQDKVTNQQKNPE